MGLDIAAYRKIKQEGMSNINDVAPDGMVRFYPNADFPASRYGSIEGGGRLYSYAEEFRFCAGSYSGYNEWRERLARMIGTTPRRVWSGDKVKAFESLINFTDCEGVLCAEVCAALAGDFAKYQERANDEDEWFKELYALWHKAVEMAADDGALSFQ